MRTDDLVEIERDYLAGLLVDPRSLADVVTVARPDDLRQDAHQRVYRAMIGLWQSGQAVDPVSVLNALEVAGEAQDVGYRYLCELALRVPTAANVSYQAGVIRDHALLRRLWMLAQEIQRDTQDPTGPAAELVDGALRQLLELSQRASPDEAVHLAQAGERLLDVLDRRAGGAGAGPGAGGVRTGLADLDRPLAQLGPGTFTILAGRTGQGKTTLAVNIARNVAWAGSPVLICSLEQSAEDLSEKVVCLETGIGGGKMQRGYLSREEVDSVLGAVARFRERPLWLYDRPRQTVLSVQALARRLRSRHGLGLVVIDYLQLVTPEDRRAKRHEQVAEISRSLKLLAGDLGVPILALSQLNREADHRPGRKPLLSDLRESGALEQDADAVLLIFWGENGQLGVDVAKNRRGPTASVWLAYDRETSRIANLAREDWYGAAGHAGAH